MFVTHRKMRMLDFSNNINYLGPPEGYIRYISDNLELLKEYSDHTLTLAKQSVANYYGISTDLVNISTGTTEFFYHFPKVVQQESLLLLSPTFWEYEYFFKKFSPNCKILFHYLDAESQFVINIDNLIEQLDTADLFIIANPNNPTGSTLDKTILEELIINKSNVLFVIDETYLPFTKNYKKNSMISFVNKVDNLIVVSSLSKIFALPGLRCGLIISNGNQARKINDYLVPYASGSLNELSIQWLLSKADNFFDYTQKTYQKQRDYLNKIINEKSSNNIKCVNTTTAFNLLRVNTDRNIIENLRNNKIIVRGGDEFFGLGKQWCRVSMKDNASLKRLVESINKAI